MDIDLIDALVEDIIIKKEPDGTLVVEVIFKNEQTEEEAKLIKDFVIECLKNKNL